MRTVLELARELGASRISSVELAQECLGKASDPAGEGCRAFVALDADKILAQARASDALRQAGIVPSPLAGLPISLKDLFDVAGETTSAGSRILAAGAPAVEDAPAVARLRAAGAVIFGRTNMTEFAYSGLGLNPHYGTPRNPYDRATGRVPGGSSSGAGVAVADGMSVAGIGTDTGGSTRIPAALCGAVGYKPTASRIPTKGVFPLAMSLDSVGPIAPSVACCAIVDAVLAAEPPKPPAFADLGQLRLLVPTTVALDDLDAPVAEAFGRLIARLRAAGARVDEAPVGPFAEMDDINRPAGLSPMEAYHVHRRLLADHGEAYDQRVRFRILAGDRASASDYIEMLATRRNWIERVAACVENYDAMLMPTVACIAPEIGPLERDDDAYRRTNIRVLRNTTLINFLDGCAVSLPCHEPGGAPVGAMLAGLGGRDRRILAIGCALEALLGAA